MYKYSLSGLSPIYLSPFARRNFIEFKAFAPCYLLSGWFVTLPDDGLAMFSRIEVSASMFFIR